MVSVQTLIAKYSSGPVLIEAYQWQFLHGGIFVPTRAGPDLGSQVIVDVRLPELKTSTLLRGYVAWRRPAHQGRRLRSGVGVEFLPSERRKRDYLLAVARGEVVDMAQRRYRRVPVDLPIGWRSKSDTSLMSDTIDDISERGAFIRTRNFRPVGSVVLLEFLPPGSQASITIQGRVAWTHHTEGEEGIGVTFSCRDAGGARRLRELVRRLEDSPQQAAGANARTA